MTPTKPGILIAIEGIDGAGKTTLAAALGRMFCDAGVPCVRSKEPTNGPWGQRIRASATTGRLSLADELHAFTEDRREHVRDVVSPAMAEGKVVVLDRYLYSTIAYQGGRGADVDAVARAMAEFPVPNAVLLIDVNPDVGAARIEDGRGECRNEFEQLHGLHAARRAFLDLAASRPEMILIDGTPPADRVRRKAVRHLLDGVLKARFCGKSYGCEQPELCGVRRAGECLWAKLCAAADLLEPVAG